MGQAFWTGVRLPSSPPASDGSQRCDPFLLPLWLFNEYYFSIFGHVGSDTNPSMMNILTCIDVHDKIQIENNRYSRKEE